MAAPLSTLANLVSTTSSSLLFGASMYKMKPPIPFAALTPRHETYSASLLVIGWLFNLLSLPPPGHLIGIHQTS